MKFDISNDDIGLLHRNSRWAGTTRQWAGSDTLELFEKNIKNPDSRKLLEFHGWLESEPVTYKYNKYGFRCDEFDNRPAGIALGCSYTEGVGVHNQDAWSSVLSKLLGVHVWNLGVGSSSIDTAFRLLDYWLPKLTPKFVVICLPNSGRVELFQSNQSGLGQTPIAVGPWSKDDGPQVNNFYKAWIDSHFNQILLKRKNLLAIQQLCDKANIPLVMKDEDVMIDTFARDTGIKYSHEVRVARDLSHPGVQNHDYFAQQIYNNLPTEIKK